MENSSDGGRTDRPRNLTLKPNTVCSLAGVSVYGCYNKNNTVQEITIIKTSYCKKSPHTPSSYDELTSCVHCRESSLQLVISGWTKTASVCVCVCVCTHTSSPESGPGPCVSARSTVTTLYTQGL